jgi:DNA-binding XRE family transcriptional regulator
MTHGGPDGATNTGGSWPKGNEMNLATAPGWANDTPPASHLQHIRAIGPNLRAARSRLGLTQGQLAERAGLSLCWISAVETGRRVPCLENLVRLCIAVGLGVDAALGLGGGR